MKSIIVIPFNVPWNWSTDYLNQTAFELTKKDHVVICYLTFEMKNVAEIISRNEKPILIKKYSKNIYIVNPMFFIPFRRSWFTRSKFANGLNLTINLIFLRLISEILAFRNNCRRKMFWIFDPNLSFIYKYFGKKYYLLYDCVDFFAVGEKKAIERTNKNENLLCQNANLVVANSVVLQNYLSKYRNNVKLVPQGFRSDNFKIKKEKHISLNLGFPIIGFVGGINNRIDTSILLPLIKNNPKWNFILWGPIQKDIPTGGDRFSEIEKILKLSNVTTGVSTDKEEIPGIVSQFDIGIIPYDSTQDFNKYCYPMKLFEYFYTGKPVVSTPIEELKQFPKYVKTGKTAAEWKRHITSLLSKPWPKTYQKQQQQLAVENSWENKVRQITDLIV